MVPSASFSLALARNGRFRQHLAPTAPTYDPNGGPIEGQTDIETGSRANRATYQNMRPCFLNGTAMTVRIVTCCVCYLHQRIKILGIEVPGI